MINLLEETIEILNENNRSESDVLWVGCPKFKTTWENFKRVANVEYDNGYGGAEVADDLIVMGIDFWLERHEYDGSEWWEFKSKAMFNPQDEIEILAVTRGQAQELGMSGWHVSTLSEMNAIKP